MRPTEEHRSAHFSVVVLVVLFLYILTQSGDMPLRQLLILLRRITKVFPFFSPGEAIMADRSMTLWSPRELLSLLADEIHGIRCRLLDDVRECQQRHAGESGGLPLWSNWLTTTATLVVEGGAELQIDDGNSYESSSVVHGRVMAPIFDVATLSRQRRRRLLEVLAGVIQEPKVMRTSGGEGTEEVAASLLLRSLQIPTALLVTEEAVLFRLVSSAPKASRRVRDTLTQRFEPSVPLRVTQPLVEFLWTILFATLVGCTPSPNASLVAGDGTLDDKWADLLSAASSAEWYELRDRGGATLQRLFVEEPKEGLLQAALVWFFDLWHVVDQTELRSGSTDGGDDRRACCCSAKLVDAVRHGSQDLRWQLLDVSVGAGSEASSIYRARRALFESVGVFLRLTASILQLLPQLEKKMDRDARQHSAHQLHKNAGDGALVGSGGDGSVGAPTSACFASTLTETLLHPQYKVRFHVADGSGRTKTSGCVSVPCVRSATLEKLRAVALHRGSLAASVQKNRMQAALITEVKLKESVDARDEIAEESYLQRRSFLDRHNRLKALRHLTETSLSTHHSINATNTTHASWEDESTTEAVVARRTHYSDSRPDTSASFAVPFDATQTLQHRSVFHKVQQVLHHHSKVTETRERHRAQEQPAEARRWRRTVRAFHGDAQLMTLYESSIESVKNKL